MATSGSKDFTVTRSEIIAAALRKQGTFDQGEPLPAAEIEDAAFALNVLLKEWSAQGIDIWLRSQVTLFLEGDSKSVYQLGPTGDHATTDTPVVQTLTSSLSAGGTTAVVGDTTGMSASDNIGIKLDDNSTFWTTISGAPTATDITLTAGPASVASSGNAVYTYTTKTERPLDLLYAMRRDTNNNDVPVDLIGEVEYQRLNRKRQEGPTTQVWYKPVLGNGELRVWPTGGNNGGYDQLIFQARFHADDMDTTSNEPEFPIEWANAIIFNLAHDLGPEYGLDRTTRADLLAIGMRKLTDLLDHSQENANVEITLDQRASGAR